MTELQRLSNEYYQDFNAETDAILESDFSVNPYKIQDSIAPVISFIDEGAEGGVFDLTLGF